LYRNTINEHHKEMERLAMGHYGYEKYKTMERLTCSARENEARVLTQGAILLERCREDLEQSRKDGDLGEALSYNQRVWTILQAALTAQDCPLPIHTRRNMLKLSLWVDRQIFKAMAAPSDDVLAEIIEINQGIAKGLRTKPTKKMTWPGNP